MPPLDHDTMLLLALLFVGFFRMAFGASRNTDALSICYILVTIAFDDIEYWIMSSLVLVISGFLSGINPHA